MAIPTDKTNYKSEILLETGLEDKNNNEIDNSIFANGPIYYSTGVSPEILISQCTELGDNPMLTTQFWRAINYKNAAYTNLMAMASILVSSLVSKSVNIYYGRVVFIGLVMYVYMVVLYLKNIYGWYMLSRKVQKAYAKKSKTKVYFGANMIVQSLFMIFGMAGILSLVYYIARSDKTLQLISTDPNSQGNDLLEPLDISLFPGLGVKVHSYFGAIFNFVLGGLSGIFLVVTDFKLETSQDTLNKLYNIKVAIVLLCIASSLIQRKIVEISIVGLIKALNPLGTIVYMVVFTLVYIINRIIIDIQIFLPTVLKRLKVESDSSKERTREEQEPIRLNPVNEALEPLSQSTKQESTEEVPLFTNPSTSTPLVSDSLEYPKVEMVKEILIVCFNGGLISLSVILTGIIAFASK
ncbi:hypothetical protein NEOKW01_0225 [Nematocida sp. AWRm80]|nr:hypothetical protein NEOKW01_0225 [Nematocida sp. AWRm80]